MSLYCTVPSDPTVGFNCQCEKSKTRLCLSGYHLLSDGLCLMERNYKRTWHCSLIREVNTSNDS